MIELIYIGEPQTVEVGAPVIYNSHAVKSCNCSEKWRNGSGSVKLNSGRYIASFSGNVYIPDDGAAGEIDFALALNGEVIPGTMMRSSSSTASRYFNISTQTYIDASCCDRISVVNLSTQDILVDNPNLIVARIGGA